MECGCGNVVHNHDNGEIPCQRPRFDLLCTQCKIEDDLQLSDSN